MRLPNESVKGQEKQHHGVVVSEKKPTRVGAKERGIQVYKVYGLHRLAHLLTISELHGLLSFWSLLLLFHPLKYFSRRFVGSSPIIQPDSIRS